jgi:hypothetical protein
MNGTLKQVNMKKRNKYIMQLILSVLISGHAFSQTEVFDIATYTPPKDWKKDARVGVVNYTNINTTSGGFCIITLYASTASTGDTKQDFNKAWKDLVVTPFKAEPNPTTETQESGDGWKVTTAIAPIKMDGADIIVMLSVISGFGKTMSIRTSLNDEAYTADIDALFTTMELSKTKQETANPNNTASLEAATGEEKFRLMMYTPPAGWSHQVFGDGVVLKPLNLPQGQYLSIQIMQPLYFSGSLEQAVQQSFDEAATMYNGSKMNSSGKGISYEKTEARMSFQGWEYIWADGGIRIGSGEIPPEYGLDLFVIKINGRFERVAILKTRTMDRSCSMSSFYADERRQYKDAIVNFLFHLRFTDQAEGSVQSNKGSSGIQGVWQGISMSAGTPSTSSPSGLKYKVFSPIFLPDGRAFFGTSFPSAGLGDLDLRILAELNRRDWGTYSFSNGRGVLRMPYGDIPLRMDGSKLIITANNTDHRFYQLPSVDGARFNGTYVMSEAYGRIPSITFTADGRFVDKGAISVLYHESRDCLNPAFKHGSGTYDVKDHTITFSYNDGRKINIAFTGAEYDRNNPSPAVLRMSSNEDPMIRQ